MASLTFRFKVNKSFLGYPAHQITIPKSDVDYSAMEADLLHQGEFTVIFPRGERAIAKMQHSEAGYGPYYQLQFRGEKREVPRYIELGTELFVVLVRMRRRNYAILEHVAF